MYSLSTIRRIGITAVLAGCVALPISAWAAPPERNPGRPFAEETPCGAGTEGQRFVLFADGTEVCDNTTGRHWQQSPSMATFVWGPDEGVNNAIDHCANLNLNGKTWRLAQIKEYISLWDYSQMDQAEALDAPNGPFENVQSAGVVTGYWSATPNALGGTQSVAWMTFSLRGDVARRTKDSTFHAWCVR